MRGLLHLGLAAGVGLALWQGIVWATDLPPFILPGPDRVARTMIDSAAVLGGQAGFTALNLAVGMGAGVALGIVTALQLALSPGARLLVRPLLVFAQAVPVFALAPIITLWLGYGAPSKIVMVALVIYFPVTSALFDGLMRLPPGLEDLAQALQARPLRKLVFLQLPNALPALGSGLRLAAVYAPFAVVVGEWVGSSRGLGYLMLMANGRGQTDLMFAALIVLAGMSVTLFFAIDRLARRWGREA